MHRSSSRHRAKWASLESLNTSTWSGSAVIGGFLADRFGYRHVFLITAALQDLALLLYNNTANTTHTVATLQALARLLVSNVLL